MSAKKEIEIRRVLSAEEFIHGLLAVESIDKVVAMCRSAKKGMDYRYKLHVAPSWHATEIKVILTRLLFSRWMWAGDGNMVRKSYDKTITQTVHFSNPNAPIGTYIPEPKQEKMDMLRELATKTIGNCVGEAVINTYLTPDQIRTITG